MVGHNFAAYLDGLPCYSELYKAFRKSPHYNSTIVVGPKGCSKTTSLILLQHKLATDGELALYVDLGNFSSSDLHCLPHVISRILRDSEARMKTLLIDNAQLLKEEDISIVDHGFTRYSCVFTW